MDNLVKLIFEQIEQSTHEVNAYDANLKMFNDEIEKLKQEVIVEKIDMEKANLLHKKYEQFFLCQRDKEESLREIALLKDLLDKGGIAHYAK